MRILATIMYLSSSYKGWQIQDNEKTIEGEVEKVLTKILNVPIKIYGAGRTDAGVHARGQTFHFDYDGEVDLNKLKYSLNCLLDKDIHILKLKKVKADFHARYSAVAKLYRYSINIGEYDPFISATTLYYPYPFDKELFVKALILFQGKHNFRNFTSKEEDEQNYIREIYSIKISQRHNIIHVDLRGNGFMRYMIRFIIGSALEVASKRIDMSYITSRLDNDSVNVSSYKAKSEGLTLLKVYYK